MKTEKKMANKRENKRDKNLAREREKRKANKKEIEIIVRYIWHIAYQMAYVLYTSV